MVTSSFAAAARAAVTRLAIAAPSFASSSLAAEIAVEHASCHSRDEISSPRAIAFWVASNWQSLTMRIVRAWTNSGGDFGRPNFRAHAAIARTVSSSHGGCPKGQSSRAIHAITVA